MIGDIPMRRFENQVHDREMIRAILDNILIVNLGINDGDYPYVVPLSFGYEMTEEQLLIYLHCAREGHKVDLWRKNPKVSLTFSTLTNHPNNLYKGAMHDFRSIMANGIIRQIPRHKSGGQHGRAVQAILRHNGRRPNQFSVPHYMFMDVYVVECDWKHVSAKSEEPMKHVKEVPFPTMEEIHECTEGSYDYSYFFSRKVYQESGEVKEHIPCAQGLAELAAPTALPFEIADAELKLGFRWDSYEEKGLDCDVLAVVLDKEGKIPRRYDIAFYNQKAERSKSIRHLGDDILTTKGQEYLSVDFKELPDYCEQIVFILAIYEADSRKQNMGMLSRLQLDLENGNAEPCSYSLGVSREWSDKAAVVLAKLVRQPDGRWMIEGPDGTLLDDWHATAVFANYGLIRWKE